MNDDLKKALHKLIMKAYRKGQASVSKEHAVDHIVEDLKDPNYKAQVPQSHLPASSEPVLNKDMRHQAISEMHGQRQMSAEAKLGKRPGEMKMPKPTIGMRSTMATAAAGAPSDGSRGGGIKMPKAPRPLQKFMIRMSEKRDGAKMEKGREKGVHSQMPGHDAGTSVLGHHIRGMKENSPEKWTPVVPLKDQHKQKLKEQKAMPKPNLPKSEKDMDKTLGAKGILKSSKGKK